MLERFDTKQFFVRCLILLAAAHALDILSTELLEHFWQGCEQNTFLKNPVDCQMLLGKAILAKVFGSALFLVPTCAGLWYATRNWALTAIPIIGMTYETVMGPIQNNLAWVAINLLSHIRS